jgi:hypothetical protein
MEEMRIDLRIIRNWVEKWRMNNGVNKTASQLAAVMLSDVLQDNEKRLQKTKTVMKDILSESRALQRLEQELLARLKSKQGMDSGVEAELKGHRRRMAALLREADEVMKVPEKDQSVRVGGLLFEIKRNAEFARTIAGEPAEEARRDA